MACVGVLEISHCTTVYSILWATLVVLGVVAVAGIAAVAGWFVFAIGLAKHEIRRTLNGGPIPWVAAAKGDNAFAKNTRRVDNQEVIVPQKCGSDSTSCGSAVTEDSDALSLKSADESDSTADGSHSHKYLGARNGISHMFCSSQLVWFPRLCTACLGREPESQSPRCSGSTWGSRILCVDTRPSRSAESEAMSSGSAGAKNGGSRDADKDLVFSNVLCHMTFCADGGPQHCGLLELTLSGTFSVLSAVAVMECLASWIKQGALSQDFVSIFDLSCMPLPSVFILRSFLREFNARMATLELFRTYQQAYAVIRGESRIFNLIIDTIVAASGAEAPPRFCPDKDACLLALAAPRYQAVPAHE